jgi:hypothetical protein
MYCSIKVPGYDTRLNINENTPRNNNYWYTGDGLKAGQCGITIARIDDKQNGQFKCSVAFQNEQTESDGVTNVTVASKNRLYSGFPVYTGIEEPCIVSEGFANAAQ